MDTLRKIMDLRSEPAGEYDPRATSMNHIHGVLNLQGPPKQLTVGHAVAGAIEGIHWAAGESGAHRVDTVFTDRNLDKYYQTPLTSKDAPRAHEKIAQAEFKYWDREHRRNPTAATQAALDFSVRKRVALQQDIGTALQMGHTFTARLQQEQTFSTGNSFAQHTNNNLPSGNVQSGNPAPSQPQYQYQYTKPAGSSRGR